MSVKVTPAHYGAEVDEVVVLPEPYSIQDWLSEWLPINLYLVHTNPDECPDPCKGTISTPNVALCRRYCLQTARLESQHNSRFARKPANFLMSQVAGEGLRSNPPQPREALVPPEVKSLRYRGTNLRQWDMTDYIFLALWTVTQPREKPL